MKKEISELEKIKRDNEKLLKWKEEYIEDFKDSIFRKRDELPKYYKKIKEKNLHAACINSGEIEMQTFKRKIEQCKKEVNIQDEKLQELEYIIRVVNKENWGEPFLGYPKKIRVTHFVCVTHFPYILIFLP